MQRDMRGAEGGTARTSTGVAIGEHLVCLPSVIGRHTQVSCQEIGNGR